MRRAGPGPGRRRAAQRAQLLLDHVGLLEELEHENEAERRHAAQSRFSLESPSGPRGSKARRCKPRKRLAKRESTPAFVRVSGTGPALSGTALVGKPGSAER